MGALDHMTEDEIAIERGRYRSRIGAYLVLGTTGAMALIVILELLLVVIAFVLVGILAFMDPNSGMANSPSGGPPPMLILGGAFGVVGTFQLLNLVPAAVSAFGAYNMLRLRSQGWAYTGAIGVIIASLLFAFSQLCLSWLGILIAMVILPLGIVSGVLALVGLQDRAVQEGFLAQARLDGMAVPD